MVEEEYGNVQQTKKERMKRFKIKDYWVTLTDELLPHDFESGSFRPYYDCVLELREEGLVAIQDEHPEFQKADWASCAGSRFYGCDDIQIGKEKQNEEGETEIEIIREIGLKVPYYVHTEKFACLSGNNLFLALDNVLCLIDLDTGELVKQVAIDRYVSSLVSVSPYQEDFILFYDGDVFRVAKDLSIRWHVRRQALFIADDFHFDPESLIQMKSDRICLRDEYRGDYYEVSYDGEVLKVEESDFTLACKERDRGRKDFEFIYFWIERY